MEYIVGAIVLTIIFFVIKSIRFNRKAKQVLQTVASDAVLMCESEGVPTDYSWSVIESDYQGLLSECKGAVKAMATAPDLSDRGISAENMVAMSLHELAKELAKGIQNEHSQEKA